MKEVKQQIGIFTLAFLVFATSAAVLIIEILATRILAPSVGSSLETYTAIIGVVLAGIAAGAWIGGKMADHKWRQYWLGPLLLISGILTALTLPITQLFDDHLADGSPFSLTALVVFSFFAPACLLSAVNPIVIKMRLHDFAQAGHVVGRYSALSTIGALTGTFLTGFVLIPLAPTSEIIVFIGTTLLISGCLTIFILNKKPYWAAGAALVLLPVALLSWQTEKQCDVESSYACAQVVTDPERPSGRYLYLDNQLNSYVDLKDPTYLKFSYSQRFAELIDELPKNKHLKVLHIGGAGLTMPRYIQATRPQWENTILELDEKVIKLAREELGWKDRKSKIIIGDARSTMKDQPADYYDLIIGDAFKGDSVPWQLTTIEADREIKRILKPDGIYLLNIIDYPPLSFLGAKINTLQKIFANILLAKTPDANFIIAASDAPLPTLDDSWKASYPIGNPQLLTDDHAPVDHLTR